ncbi:cullin-associated NEDD8-dissociated protein 1 isoform X2 [Chrysoperla carnea]|uniref:cullin-associated NEDD8-dissociated protein 1 isoform X2 n=1 Tax=Chrysoperla carnea TaxID=189513 RepID=UPI001D07AAD1|nr:cullin-associated NEDD8-dissociated protein 1 isoform X2 [Chrysoperla carnea]
MANVSYQISNLLEKMCSTDKDFRFMATNDLMNELQKDSIKLDDESERKVVRMVLKLLEDKNGEVQNLAVKCLGPLVNKVKEFQVETIVDTLCTNMVSDKEQLRDISSIGLKTVICELPSNNHNLVANVCRRITGRLSTAIEKQEDVSVQLEALDILADLLSRFGSLIIAFQQQILNSLLPQLCSSRQAVRKRTIVALGYFVLSCSPQMYSKIINYLLESLSSASNTASSAAIQSTNRTYIQCMAAICRHAGHRFGDYMVRIVPVVVAYSQEDDEELREYCLQAFEAFVHRCPKEMTPYIPTITDLCLNYMTYDPNYNYDSDEDDTGGAGMMETEDDNGDNDDDNDEYSDDDDMSWKVRRSAAKCLEAIIITRHELMVHFYKYVSPALISRFKEREENVKSDIFHAYIALLRQTKSLPSRDTVAVPVTGTAQVPSDHVQQMNQSPITMLQKQIPDIVKAVHKLMRDKSIKTRQDCFSLLKELVTVLPGALTNHIEALIPGIIYSLGDKNSSSNMKIDTLNFVHCLITTHSPAVFHPHMGVLMPPIVAAVGDSFYKITAEALNVLRELVKVIRPLETPIAFDFTIYTDDIYKHTLIRLRAQDIDQEVKERAIACMGQILCNLGDYLQRELCICLPIFLDRLKNEITRLTTVKALNKVAASPLKIDLRSILDDAVPILGSFLRKNQRSLKLASLTLLDTLIRNYSSALSPELLQKVVVEMPPLINESDLHIAQLTLTLLTSISELQPLTLVDQTDLILPEVITLVKSPLLQGVALQAMLEFFQVLVRARLPKLSRTDLLVLLVQQATSVSNTGGSNNNSNSSQSNKNVNVNVNVPVLHKQAFHSLAKCVAAVVISDPQEALLVVEQFLKDLQETRTDAHHIFALFVVGEIGRHIDLSSVSNLKPVILHSFSPPSEEIKSAASYALGSVAVGNLPLYIPFILGEIETKPKRQYLLLHSLKEVITCMSATPSGVQSLMHFIPAIWAQLFKHCECSEEGTRNVVAECLGKLTLINPQDLLPRLQDALSSQSPLMRTTVVTAVKFTISDQPQTIDPLLRQSMRQFLTTLQDPDLNVRRVALVAFNSAAHNKPSLVRDLLEYLLPQLYQETIVKKELIRELEMGPFKHTVDDGLDIRKAAFECMYTLLDTCLDRLDIFEFLNHVESGLKDHYDIKMLTYLMVARLATLCPNTVLQRLERLVEPLRATCTLKVKANSVKQEYEKQDELKRSALRAVAALYAIPDAEKNPYLTEFVGQIKATIELQPIFESIQKDSHQSGGHHSLIDSNQMDQS